MTHINHHPAPDLLRDFAAGTLAPSTALLIAAHREYCSHCQQQIANHEALLAQTALEADGGDDQPALDGMLETLLAHLPEHTVREPEALPTAIQPLTLHHRTFELPQVLARQLHQPTRWSALPGRLHQARLAVENSHLNFIHMDKNSGVPTHTHKGREYTLVLHGGFSDANGDYRLGDFVCLDQRHQHQPQTDSHEDCLVISALEGPLHFTSGLARLFNPLSQLFFR
ncbi:ChrR family anti-sigma-E factor [Ferrimonas pelagia]|uniref:ChrR family anti-sigma-E factor n=1 Tax=Ferrimonas pelagia TaxID=1177826 RepID=A0ABP9FDU0_9GAMM